MFVVTATHFLGKNDILSTASDDSANSTAQLCTAEAKVDPDCAELKGADDGGSVKDVGSLVAIFFGIFLYGIGVSFYYSFGVPYVDDNADKRQQSPMLLSVVMVSRTLGPSLG